MMSYLSNQTNESALPELEKKKKGKKKGKGGNESVH